MRRSRIIVVPALLTAVAVLAVAVLAVVASAAPAQATEGSTESETTTTITDEPVFEGDEPAVVIPPGEDAEEEQPWTSRFIYPTIVAVTIILILGIAFAYNRRIRRRYKVVA